MAKTTAKLKKTFQTLEALDRISEDIHKKILLQEDNFSIYEIAFTDNIVKELKERKISKIDLNSWKSIAKEKTGRICSGILKSLKSAEKQSKHETWWSRLVEFFKYIFRKSKWQKEQLSLKLTKLRSNSMASHNEFSDEERTAIYRLSIKNYYGFTFTNREVQLIERMAGGRSHLTSTDHDLITEISQCSMTGTQRKLLELKVHFSQIAREYPNIINSDIVKALQELEEKMKRLKKWSSGEVKLYNRLGTMKDIKAIPPHLGKSKRWILERVIIQWKRSERMRFYMKAFVMLGIKPEELFSKAEKAVATKLRRWYEFYSKDFYSGSIGCPFDFSEEQWDIVRRHVEEYDSMLDSGRQLFKNAQLIDTAKSHVQTYQDSTVEKTPLHPIFRYSINGLKKLEKLGAQLSVGENLVLKGLKSKRNPSLSQKELEKLAVEGIILETGGVPTYLQESVIVLDSTNTKHLSPLTTTDQKIIGILKGLGEDELEELKRLGSLSRNDPEFKSETKFIRMLRILIEVDIRSNFNVEKTRKLLQRLIQLKKNEIQRARSQFEKREQDMNDFQSIEALPGLEKVLYKFEDVSRE
ncbi:hypothetical protein PGTUg99_012949 [Puccinia graminis f. sp. tritici]|uniref:Uncharacterized protein n=2 Tax=Puccinia graminis f. sp. tritici TaxID=56615 RepID=A0A5B0RRA9_PUCGR|nr:hypothetical protein PGTUg99_012949 [Puccinia graminis f. sp. tritici]